MPRERYQDPTLQCTKRGIWFIRPAVDRIGEHGLERAKKTIVIGKMGKREAQARANEIMRTINRADYVITSQIKLSAFLEEFDAMHIAKLGAATQVNYRGIIKRHIAELGKERLCDLEPLLLQKWMDKKTGLSWAAKKDVRKVLGCVFNKAIEWGRWKDRNPVSRLHIGRKRPVYEQRKLSLDDTRRLLGALPWKVRLLCSVCLFGTLRISEALGLQVQDLDFERSLILIRRRFYRGDLDEVKTVKSRREVPMGYLKNDLWFLSQDPYERDAVKAGHGLAGNAEYHRQQETGDADLRRSQVAQSATPRRSPDNAQQRGETADSPFLFQIEIYRRTKPIARGDDSDIRNLILRPAAKALGIYWRGFGFHALRREAVTELSALLGANAAQRLAGHATADMTLHYTLADREAQEAAIRQRQETILGKDGGKIQ